MGNNLIKYLETVMDLVCYCTVHTIRKRLKTSISSIFLNKNTDLILTSICPKTSNEVNAVN